MAFEQIVTITADDSGIVQSLQDISSQASVASSSIDEIGQSVTESFNPKGLDKFEKELGDTSKAIKKASDDTTKLNSNTKKTATSVNQLSNSVGVLGRSFGGLRSGIRNLGKAFKALLANPVLLVFVALVGAVTALFKAFSSTKKGAEFLGQASAALGAVLDVLRDIVVNVGSAIISAFENPLESIKSLGKAIITNVFNRFKAVLLIAESTLETLKALGTLDYDRLKKSVVDLNTALTQLSTGLDAEQQKAFGNAIKNTTEEIKREAAAAFALQKQLDAVVDTQRRLSVQRAKLNTQLVKARDIASDANKPLAERIEALDNVIKLEDTQLKKEIAAQGQRVKALKALASQSDSDKQTLDEIAQAEIKLANLRTQSEQRLLNIRRQRQSLDNQAIKQQADIAAFQLEINNLLVDESKKTAEQIALDEKKARDKSITDSLVSKKNQQDLLLVSEQVYQKQLEAIKVEAAAKAKLLQKTTFDAAVQDQLKNINLQAEIATLELDSKQEKERQSFAITAKSEAEITDFQRVQSEERALLELQLQQTRLEAIRAFSTDATEEEKKRLDTEIELVKTSIRGVGVAIEEEKAKTKGSGLFGMLGLGQETQSNIQAIQGALNQVTKAVSDAVGEQIKALQKEVDFRNDKIDDLKSDLATEIDLANLGKAANIENIQDQIKKEEKARDIAEQKKKEAAKTQFALDTALQASNLITSISALYSSLSGLPFGIGVALATALSAVMIGSFVASKVSVGNSVGFKDGGYTGNMGVDDEAGVTHGQEFVLDAKTTKDLKLKGKTMQQARSLLLGNHSTDLNNGIQVNLQAKKQRVEAARYQAYKDGIKEAINGQSKYLTAIREAVKQIPTVIPLGDKAQVRTKDNKGNTTIETVKASN